MIDHLKPVVAIQTAVPARAHVMTTVGWMQASAAAAPLCMAWSGGNS